MKKYSVIKEDRLTNDAIFSTIVKRKINEWAASVPNHPYPNLGNLIDINELWYRPTYYIKINTLYESRKLHKKVVPYNGQELPKQEYFKESDIDVWGFDLDVSEGFGNGSENFKIAESQFIERCAKCGGNGSLVCSVCNGQKQITCNSCKGKKTVTCKSCSGKGQNRCTHCNGKGSINKKIVEKGTSYYITDDVTGERRLITNEDRVFYRDETCFYCGGRGFNKCGDCFGEGSVVCKTCNGKGKIDCSNCHSTGSVVCPTCNGKKYLLHGYFIERIDHTDTMSQFILNNSVFSTFPEYKTRLESFSRETIFSKIVDRFSLDYLPQKGFIDKNIEVIIEKAFVGENSNHRIAKQLFEVECLDTWVVDYNFNGKSYSLAFAGKEMEIIPGRNPISDCALEYVDSATSEFNNDNVVEAYNLFIKAQQIDSFELRDKVGKGIDDSLARIHKSHKFGVILGIIVSLIAIIPYCYFYYFHINWVFGYAKFMKEPDFFLFRHHPWAMIALSLYMMYSTYVASLTTMNNQIKFKPKFSSRILTSIGVTFFYAILMQATIMLLNATAFTLLFTFIAWLFTFYL